jgi:hypothetical protein
MIDAAYSAAMVSASAAAKKRGEVVVWADFHNGHLSVRTAKVPRLRRGENPEQGSLI